MDTSSVAYHTVRRAQDKLCCHSLVYRYECRVVVIDGNDSQIIADESGRELQGEWRNASTHEASLPEYMDITVWMNAHTEFHKKFTWDC